MGSATAQSQFSDDFENCIEAVDAVGGQCATQCAATAQSSAPGICEACQQMNCSKGFSECSPVGTGSCAEILDCFNSCPIGTDGALEPSCSLPCVYAATFTGQFSQANLNQCQTNVTATGGACATQCAGTRFFKQPGLQYLYFG